MKVSNCITVSFNDGAKKNSINGKKLPNIEFQGYI